MFTCMDTDDIFIQSADTLKQINAFPCSPRLPEDMEFDRLPPPIFEGDRPLRVKKEEILDDPFPSFFHIDVEDLEASSMSSESESSGYFQLQETKIEDPFHSPPALNVRDFNALESLNDVLLGSDMYTGFSEVKHRYESFTRLISQLIPILKKPVVDHDLTQAQRNHLKNIMKGVQKLVGNELVAGVLDERTCEWSFQFDLDCPLPMDKVYRENIEQSRIYFFKDCAKTYIDPVTGVKSPYALEMNVAVLNAHGLPLNRDVDVKIGLFRVFEGGRTEEVPEFKMENGKRKRCWGMIMGDVLKGKSRICVKNKGNDKSASTAVQTLYNGRGKLYGRVEIPATPGDHHWVLTPANLHDDIGKAIGQDFVVKSKRTARKRKRDEIRA